MATFHRTAVFGLLKEVESRTVLVLNCIPPIFMPYMEGRRVRGGSHLNCIICNRHSISYITLI